MRAVDDWLAFANALGPAAGAAASTAGEDTASRWTLVFAKGGRPLALPANRLAAPESLDFFLSRADKWWWAQLSMLLQRIVPGALPQGQLSADQHRQLQGMFCTDAGLATWGNGDVLAIQFGSNGPLQKVMVLGCDDSGSWQVVKLALRASADERIVAEAACLRQIAAYPELAAHVPLVSHTGTTPSGRPFFTMGAVIGEPAARKFGPQHIALLRSIARADFHMGTWQESVSFQNIEARLPTLVARCSDDLDVLRAGWSAGCQAVVGQRMPLCLNHGDFTAWNLLQTEAGLLALDWEYAQIRANPLADFFHFHLISTALDGSLRKGGVKRDELLSSARQHASEIFGDESPPVLTHALPLLLFYLVDTVSFYAKESGGIDRNDPVVDAYLQFIAELT